MHRIHTTKDLKCPCHAIPALMEDIGITVGGCDWLHSDIMITPTHKQQQVFADCI